MQIQPAIDHGIRVIKDFGKKMFSFDQLTRSVESGLYTATVRGILLYHVNVMKRLVSYGDLATATKTLPKGGQLAQALERIAEDDHLNKRPLSTAIVVNDKTKMPGEGFFKQCRALGHPIPATPEGELLFWKQLLQTLGVLPIVSDGHVTTFGGEDMLANLDVDRLRKEGEVGVLEGLWPIPAKLPGEAGYTEKKPVPDISQHPEIKGLREAANARAKTQAQPKGPLPRAFPDVPIEENPERVVATLKDPREPKTRMTPKVASVAGRMELHPGSCVHANEVPNVCPCPKGCYCKCRTCAVKADEALVTLFSEGAIERERELSRQVDEANEKDAAKRVHKVIRASQLKEDDLVLLPICSKPMTVKTVSSFVRLTPGGGTSREVQWTDTLGNQYVCEGSVHMTTLVEPKTEEPSSQLP